MYYETRNSKAIATLNPAVQTMVHKLMDRLDQIGEDVLIVSARRTEQEQDDLFARGRTKEGKVVTHVNDSNSYHVWGCAIDIVPVTLLKPQWNAYPRYEKIAKEAMALGFRWGFAMWGFDYGHFHYAQGLTIEDLKSGKTLTDTEPVDFGVHYKTISQYRRIQRMIKKASGSTLDRLLKRLNRQF